MSEVQPSDILLRCGGRTLMRHGVLCIAGGRKVHSPSYRLVETFTRADATTCATYIDRDGLIRVAAANVPRIEFPVALAGTVDAFGYPYCGPLLEGTRTNVVLWSRDMTNAAWTKTTMTAAKDQVGVDGVTNSASSLLATAGNATCLQAIVLGSSQRAQAVWVKRLVGVGTINMTMDNGATWTVITLTGSWTRVTIPSQTLANPTVGFRIVTSADKIAVDYVQNENGAFESSAIATTTAAITRAADSLSVPFNAGPMDHTMLGRIARPVHADAAGSIVSAPHLAELAGAVPRLTARLGSGSRVFVGDIDTAVADAQQTAAIPAGTTLSTIWQYKTLTTTGQIAIDAGAGLSAFSAAASGFSVYGNQTLRIGCSHNAGEELFGVLLDLMPVRGLRTLAEALAVP